MNRCCFRLSCTNNVRVDDEACYYCYTKLQKEILQLRMEYSLFMRRQSIGKYYDHYHLTSLEDGRITRYRKPTS